MSILDGKKVIAIEEHYYDDEVTKTFTGVDARTGGFVREALEEVGAARIKSMDDNNIDVQVLSHGAPSGQKLDAENGPAIAAAANDRLKEICDVYPDRFKGFAALATAASRLTAATTSLLSATETTTTTTELVQDVNSDE